MRKAKERQGRSEIADRREEKGGKENLQRSNSAKHHPETHSFTITPSPPISIYRKPKGQMPH
jgi:hypothetical protein